jgi:hypothetical protein
VISGEDQAALDPLTPLAGWSRWVGNGCQRPKSISNEAEIKSTVRPLRIIFRRTSNGAATVAELNPRELRLIKKALEIAVLAVERMPGEFQSSSDQADMKALLDQMIGSDTELAF